MSWDNGDFAEELFVGNSDQKDDNFNYYCPWCRKNTDLWFDRTISYLPDGTEIGMKDRCVEYGRATDDLPEEVDSPSFREDIGEAENDGG